MSKLRDRFALKSGASVVVLATALTASASDVRAGSLPAQGHFVNGHGLIDKAGRSLTVQQSSIAGIIDWNNFSIGRKNSVSFDNGSGATLNRVTGGNLSRIAGSLRATGSLYLINTQGVIVSGTGRVVTGGNFVASGGDLSGSAFGADDLRFRSAKAAVINRGSITSGGSTTLAGSSVRNIGTLTAASATLHASTGEVLGGGTMRATGGTPQGGDILLISTSGKTKITGDLIARNANGSGGSIETSGRKLSIGGTIDAGTDGNWLVDPVNLKVGAAAATIIDSTLDEGTNITLKTTATGKSGPGNKSKGPGDIVVASALSWDTSAKLTLDAYHSVVVNAAVSVTGLGALTLTTDDGGSGGGDQFGSHGKINFANLGSALVINGARYTLVNSIATLADDIKNKPSGDYALAENYNAKAHGKYKHAAITTTFSGTFEGLGNTINNLKIKSNNEYIGLFALLGAKGTIRNLNLTGVEITGTQGDLGVGGVAGKSEGQITRVSVTGRVTGKGDVIGGLVGDNGGTGKIDYSHSAAIVADNDTTSTFAYVGGLVGLNYDLIANSYATKAVTETAGNESDIGGLVGWNDGGSVSSSHAIGDVSTNSDGDYDEVGGLVGRSGYLGTSTISSSYATGNVSGGGFSASVGGLVGAVTETSSVTGSQASGSATGSGQYAFVGGLVGDVTDTAGLVSNSQASGAVTGGPDSDDGGLIGANAGTVSGSTASGPVSAGTGSCTGSLIGYPNSTQAGCE